MPIDDYRRLAANCLRMAERATQETTRAMLRHLAEVWTRLAEEDEPAQQRATENWYDAYRRERHA